MPNRAPGTPEVEAHRVLDVGAKLINKCLESRHLHRPPSRLERKAEVGPQEAVIHTSPSSGGTWWGGPVADK